MAYVPQNLTVFTSAYAGCMSGLTASGRQPKDTVASDYAGYGFIAGAFAQAFDTAWGTPVPDTLQVFMIFLECKSVWDQRNSKVTSASLLFTNYTQLCNAIIASIMASESYFTGQSIVPSTWPSGLGSNPFTLQPVWWIDPQNKSSNASNLNKGDLKTAPLLTFGEVLRRYGSNSPTLTQSTSWNFLSSSPHDGTDPIAFRPVMKGIGSAPRINGAFGLVAPFAGSLNIAVSSGVLAGVVPRNYAAGQKLAADIGPGAAVGMKLINTTGGKQSVCSVYKHIAGNVWELDQPLTISNNFPITDPLPLPVDTYANGDTFSLYNEDLIDLVEFIPTICDFDANNTNSPILTGIGVASAVAPNLRGFCSLGTDVSSLYGRFDRRVLLRSAAGSNNNLFIGTAGIGGIRGGYTDIDNVGNGVWVYGGFWGSVDLIDSFADADVIFSSAFTRLTGGLIGSACVDTGATLAVDQELLITPFNLGVSQLWGGGSLDVRTGRVNIQGLTAAAALLQLGGSTLDGHANAFTASLANPSVVNGAVVITPANIDTAGFMYFPGGGSIAVN
jgi:hypothetical protein